MIDFILNDNFMAYATIVLLVCGLGLVWQMCRDFDNNQDNFSM